MSSARYGHLVSGARADRAAWVGALVGWPVLVAAFGCSSVCSRDAVDRGSGARRGETRRLPVQSRCWTIWTGWAFVDAGRLTHNPEVAGSNPAPATSFRRSRPFPSREGAFCARGAVAKGVAATAPRTAWQRDGLTRDETAWTWWTLPPATSGCLAQKYRKCIRSVLIRAGLAGTCGARG